MEKHWVPVKKELIVLNIIVVTERQSLCRILTKGKDSNPGFGVFQNQMYWDVKDFSTDVEVDDVGLPRVGFVIPAIVRFVQIVHRGPWFHRAVLGEGKLLSLFLSC